MIVDDDILSLMVFGSAARGDPIAGSDVDLLGIANGRNRRVDRDPVSLSLYSPEKFLEIVECGSLFAWHLKEEGLILADHRRFLRTALGRFRLKASYQEERSHGAIAGWLLFASDGLTASSDLIINTILYSIRTIAYSKLAELKKPAFSRMDVCAVLGDDDLAYLWSMKNEDSVPSEALTVFSTFLESVGPRPPWLGQSLSEISASTELPRFARIRSEQLRRNDLNRPNMDEY